MKKDVEIKYPHSAVLFQFCRRVLDHKFGGVRVIDQDVGQILGYDPADCSHWKKGKKNIRSIQAIKSIADHLGVDERLVIDIAAGDLTESEAFFEYSGYGEFAMDPLYLEQAKKDFFRRSAGTWGRDAEEHFRKLSTPAEGEIRALVEGIHERIQFKETPLYLPEVVNAYPDLKMVPNGKAHDNDSPVRLASVDGITTIFYAAGMEMKPYVRYRLAHAIGTHFLMRRQGDAPGTTMPPEATEELTARLRDVEANLFSAMLLCPEKALRHEIAHVNIAKDIVAQLSESFWVSKVFMNRWLRHILKAT